MATNAKFGTRSLNSLNGIEPDLKRVLEEAILYTPFDFTITDGVRTTAQQQYLYSLGRSLKIINGVKQGIVTNADGVKSKSNHQIKSDGYGHAVDLYPFVNGVIDLEDKQNLLPIIAGHILGTANRLGVKIEWGGLWKGILDKPHFELKK